MRKLACTTLVFFLSFGLFAQSEDSHKSKKQERKEKQEEVYQAYMLLLREGNFDFIGTTAYSNNGNSQNIQGEINYVRIRKNEDGSYSGDIYMPFFGSSQTINTFNQGTDTSIIYKGTLNGFKMDLNDKNGMVSIRWTGKRKSEDLDFALNFYKNATARLSVNSSGRSGMQYDGYLRQVNKGEEMN